MDNENIRLIEPSILIHPQSLVLYSKVHWTVCAPYRKSNSLKNLESNFNHNNLSTQAKRKMTKAIKYLIYTASEKTAYNNKTKSTFKFKVNMVTLTLASKQIHSDQEIKSKLLNQLLLELKERYHVKNYVWKSEYQNNGNIHFHILTDKFIPWNELQNRWNRIQNKLGYIDRIVFTPKNKQPNSTDVHSLRKIKNIASYCTKYMTKENKRYRQTCKREESPLGINHSFKSKFVTRGALEFLRKEANNGRIWGASYLLSYLDGGKSELNSELLKEIEVLQKTCGATRIDKERYSLVLFEDKCLRSGKFPKLCELLDSFIVKHFGYRQNQLILNQYEPERSQ
jgi:hypothetical protein